MLYHLYDMHLNDEKNYYLVTENCCFNRCCNLDDYFKERIQKLHPDAFSEFELSNCFEFSCEFYDYILIHSIEEFLSMSHYNMYKHMLMFIFKEDAELFLNFDYLCEELEKKLNLYMVGVKKWVRKLMSEGFDEADCVKLNNERFYLLRLKMKSNELNSSVNIFGVDIGRKQLMIWTAFVLSECLQKSLYFPHSKENDVNTKKFSSYLCLSYQNKSGWISDCKFRELKKKLPEILCMNSDD
jgi:hypothetical protein